MSRKPRASACAVLSLLLVLAACSTSASNDASQAGTELAPDTALADDAAGGPEVDNAPADEDQAGDDPAGDGHSNGGQADKDQSGDAAEETAATPDTEPDLQPMLTVADIDCATPGGAAPTGLSDEGEVMFERYLSTGAQVPTYQLAVDVDPSTGTVAGAMRATVPAQDRSINFRVFAGMSAFDSGLEVSNIHLNGEAVAGTLDAALLSLPAAAADDQMSVVELDFNYTIAQMAANTSIFDALGGDSLQPDQVGLLGRTGSGMQLGHWFPVWLPDGTRIDPDPSGFGDIGAFPAARICATISVPDGYEVVTSGSRVDATGPSIVEAGVGLRDFSIVISNDLQLTAGVIDNVEIRVWGPAGDPESLKTVLGYAEQSQAVLHDAFGPYPWQEIDLVSAPLGAGVGGMEWPGMIWIEQETFAGGLPGMGELGDLFGHEDQMVELLESIGGPALSTTLEWTIAHELGHEWWHATVGNDSIASPSVDEPLAQLSACLAMQAIHPDNWLEICEAQTTEQFAQARSIGIADTIAEQASDRFDSSLQYGAVVYGKAPGFYLAAADLIGWQELVDALRSFVDENSFALVSTDELRSHLIAASGDDGEAIGALWDRWFREAKGDEDIEPSNIFDTFGDIEGLEDLDLNLEDLDLDELLDDLPQDE